MEKLWRVFYCLLLLATSGIAHAQFTYTTNDDGTLTLTAYDYSSPGDIVIPNSVNGRAVTAIGPGVFNNNVNSVEVPASVTSLSDESFYGIKVYCQGNAPMIEPDSFYFCTVYYLPGTSGWDQISGNFYLTSELTFAANNGAITINGYAGPDNVNLVIPNFIDGLPVNSIAALSFFSSKISSIVFPPNVTSIGYDAFVGCSLTNVVFSEGLTNIGDLAFSATAIDQVTLPASLSQIEGGSAFIGCTNLHAIFVNSNSTAYGSFEGVLYDKSRKTLIEFPAGRSGTFVVPGFVADIGPSAFYNCALTNVIISEGVTKIENSAFYLCQQLATVRIPASMTNIASQAFPSCPALTGVFFEGPAPATDLSQFSPNTIYHYYLAPGFSDGSWIWGVQAIADTKLGVQNQQFGFDTAGDGPVVIEYTTNLANPDWTILAYTNYTFGTVHYFNDPQWTNAPSRFYKVDMP